MTYWKTSEYQDRGATGLCIDTYRSQDGNQVNGVIRILSKDKNGNTNNFAAHTISADDIDSIISELNKVKQRIINNKQSMSDEDIKNHAEYERFWKESSENDLENYISNGWKNLIKAFRS